jgi:hypothetical protein
MKGQEIHCRPVEVEEGKHGTADSQSLQIGIVRRIVPNSRRTGDVNNLTKM